MLDEINELKVRLGNLEAKLLSAPAGSPSTTPAQPAEAALPSQSPEPQASAATALVKPAPFSFADFTWLNGNPRNKDSVLDSKYFTGEFRVDSSYIYDYNHPIDHSLEVQHLGVGGDFQVGNMQGRILTQFGMYSTATPCNDASPAVGQWNLSDACRYVSEA